MMKNLLLMASLLVSGIISAQTDTPVTVNLQPGYANQVFYKFSTNTQTSVAANTWDLALLRLSSMTMGVRVNDSRGIRVFEVSDNVADWNTVDVANQANWTELYNSETEWTTGALDNGSATYGWGEYNPVNHHVTGSVVFALKYSETSYKKIVIEDYFGGYTVTYSAWNGNAWSAAQTTMVANALSPGYTFNFLSLDTHAPVAVSPADADWDLAFGRYFSNLNAGTDLEPSMYLVTGVMHNPATVSVARTDETGASATAPVLPAADAYSDNINTIGDKWKTFNMNTFMYVIDPQTTYYVKHIDGTVYRMYFTAFGGSSTGTMSFNYRNASVVAGLEDVSPNISFGVYPNPGNGNVSLVYELKNTTADKNSVSVYSLAGAKVFETEITGNSGLYTKDLNLTGLSGGVYILKLQSGQVSQTKKLIIQ